MNHPSDDLLLRRGRLIERIASQREGLRRDFKPVARALDKADLAVAGIRAGAGYLHRHALAASAVAGFLLIFKGRTTLRWAGRAYSLWKSWRLVRHAFLARGDRVRS